MDIRLMRIFQRQVADECRIMLVMADSIGRALHVGDSALLWGACPDFLTGAGNAAGALWGFDDKADAQREPLRNSLHVDDASPLRVVALRKDLDGFRRTNWGHSSKEWKGRHQLGRLTGPPPSAASFDIFFHSERVNVRPIVVEAARILPIALREAALPYW